VSQAPRRPGRRPRKSGRHRRPGARRRGPARRRPTGRRRPTPLEADLAHYRDTRSEMRPETGSEPDRYVGNVIGPCKLVQFLAAGGTGRVYRAHHQRLNFEVAFKLIDPKVAKQETMLKRFQREAQVSARLNHPNVARVYDVDTADGVHYIIQELVRGTSVEVRVQRDGTLEELACAQIGRALASGLDSIHQAGVVHRDVKPDNVILTADEEPKLLDFGIAKAVDAHTDTHQDTVLGTPKFMAPEQANDHSKVGPPTDVYGLGATLFYALAGRAPLEPEEGEGLFTYMNRRLSAPPPRLRDHVPRAHPQLAELIDAMLHPDPDRRPTAADAERQFTELEQAIGVATGSVSRTAVQAALRKTQSFTSSGVFSAVVGGQGTRGTFAELPLPEILQGIEFNEKTGELDIHSDALNGRITFKSGQPHDASTSEGDRAQAAVSRLLDLSDANFVLRRDALVSGARQIPVSFTRILLDHTRTSDESDRMEAVTEEDLAAGDSVAAAAPEAEEIFGSERLSKTLRMRKIERLVSSGELDRGAAMLLEVAGPQPAGDPYLGVELGLYRMDTLIEVVRGERRYLATHKVNERRGLAYVFPLEGRHKTEFSGLAERAEPLLEVKHPNLLPVRAHGKSRRAFYVVYPPPPLQTLERQRLPLPLEKVLRLLGEVALALQPLHARKLVHGHLSLETIREDEGAVLVCASGLARTPDEYAFLSTGGEVLGYPGFIAPELLDRRPLTPAADMYSLGCVAYTLLSGGAPPPLIGQGQEGLSLPESVQVPETVQILLKKLWGRTPKRRYTDASAFLDDLATVERGKSIEPFPSQVPQEEEPTGPQEKPKLDVGGSMARPLWLVLLVLALAANGVLGFIWQQNLAEIERTPVTDPLTEFRFDLSPQDQ